MACEHKGSYMFKQKISISIKSEFDRNKLSDEFEMLMGNLYKAGQVIVSSEKPFVSENELISFQTTLEKSSLSKKHNNEYVNRRIKNLEQWCNSRLKTEVIGKVISDGKGVCSCKKPPFYILFTHVLNDSGCLDCGTCRKTVPLYKLKQLECNDKFDILSWEGNYKSCDNLQLGCTVGEKWATNQMSNPDSQLSKQGKNICNRITELTGIAAYYYLYNYRHISHTRDKARPCPACNRAWILKERLFDFYDFKCDNCRLISSFSPVTNQKGS